MTLSADERSQIEKDLNNSERFILEKLSSDRKSNYRKFEKVNADNAELLKEIRIMSANVETSILLQKDLEKRIDEELWLVTWFYKHTKTTYFTIPIFIFTFADKLHDVYKVIEKKYIG